MTGRGIREGPRRRIECHPQRRAKEPIARVPFNPFHEEPIERILTHHQGKRTRGRRHMIDPARRLLRRPTLPIDASLSGPNLELPAVDRRTHPVPARETPSTHVPALISGCRSPAWSSQM